MKRRNNRPGRRHQTRSAGGGPLPLPLLPDSHPPRLGDSEGGLYAPARSDDHRGPILFGRDTRQPHHTAMRPGRPSSARPLPGLAQAVQVMRGWESYGMRLQMN